MGTRRHQRPVKGRPRIQKSPQLLDKIVDEIVKVARQFKVSESFVMSCYLAEALGIEEQEKYYPVQSKKRRA